MSNEEYDEKTCITAAELRYMGIDIPKHIPDVAWIPRRSMRFKQTGNVRTTDPGGRIELDFVIEFTKPFQYVVLNIELDAPLPDGVA